ncbi:MAG: alpha/beta hydrolase [Rhodobacter sp.]|nr:alpha/beta hydrolase [Rhodobacter sp.]MCY4169037.1 alpha/beta hydrolase [Rhodobacter sp.]MCY4240307.1 alpha/beta hydrolase [Rhodobacter sp.]
MTPATRSARAREIEALFRSQDRHPAFNLQRERENTAGAHELTGIPSKVTIRDEIVADVACLRIVPDRPRSRREAIYLHGGAFCLMSAWTHHRLAGHIANVIADAVLVPDYALAPEAPFPVARDQCAELIRARRRAGVTRLILIGDSAGGGLALSAVCHLRDSGGPLPDAMVLLSPWLDLSLSGPDLRAGIIDDPILTLNNLRNFAALYLDGRNVRDPDASPLWNRFDNLPPLLAHSAELDLLREDVFRLADAWPDAPSIQHKHFPGMLHSFHFFAGTMPEADQAVREIGRFVDDSI